MSPKKKVSNKAASVRAMLFKHATEKHFDFNNVLVRYVNERIIYRLSVSPFSNEFILKGGTLISAWLNEPHRPTKDVDLLGKNSKDPEHIKAVFQAILGIDHDDGLQLDVSTLDARTIKENDKYEGVRITFVAFLEKAKVPVQIDIGFGDAVLAKTQSLPTILEVSLEPEIQAYPIESVISEKFEAMVTLGMANSRMKDFFDLFTLSKNLEFEGSALSSAIAATFQRRNTEVPTSAPTALTSKFFENSDKQKQWKSFIRKIGIKDDTLSLESACLAIARFIMLPSIAASNKSSLNKKWSKDGQWLDALKSSN